jgi:hypothetical protein
MCSIVSYFVVFPFCSSDMHCFLVHSMFLSSNYCFAEGFVLMGKFFFCMNVRYVFFVVINVKNRSQYRSMTFYILFFLQMQKILDSLKTQYSLLLGKGFYWNKENRLAIHYKDRIALKLIKSKINLCSFRFQTRNSLLCYISEILMFFE